MSLTLRASVVAAVAKGGVVWHPVKPVAEGRAKSSGLALVAEVGTIMAQGGSATFLRIGVGMAFFDR